MTLAGGPRPVTEIEAEAASAGIAWRTIRRAKTALAVATERKAESGEGLGAAGRWYWRMPPGPAGR